MGNLIAVDSITLSPLMDGEVAEAIQQTLYEYYLINNDGVNRPQPPELIGTILTPEAINMGWGIGDDIPTPTKDKPYLWNYEVITYSDGRDNYTNGPFLIGKIGLDGVGLKDFSFNVSEQYAASTDKDAAPSIGWHDKLEDAQVSWGKTNRYLWNKTIFIYSYQKDGEAAPTETTEEFYHLMAIYALDGEKGVGFYKYLEFYKLGTDAVPTSKNIKNDLTNIMSAISSIDFSDEEITTYFTTDGWTNDVTTLTMNDEKPYIWNCEVTIYDNKEFVLIGPFISINYAKDGVDGNGIKNIKEYYLATNSTAAPSNDNSNWEENYENATSSEKWHSDNQYLWNKTVVIFDDDTKSISKHISSIFTTDGQDGNTFWTSSVAAVNQSGLYKFNNVNLMPAVSESHKPQVGDQVYYSSYYYTISEITADGVLCNRQVNLKGESGEDGYGIDAYYEFYKVGTKDRPVNVTNYTNSAITSGVLSALQTESKDISSVFIGWNNDIVSEVGNLNKTNAYLWNVEVTVFKNGAEAAEANVVGPFISSYFTTDGKGISEVLNEYQATNGTSEETLVEDNWESYENAKENWGADSPYLWNKITIKYEGDMEDSVSYHISAIFTTDGVNGNTFWASSVAPFNNSQGKYEFSNLTKISPAITTNHLPQVGDQIYYDTYIYTVGENFNNGDTKIICNKQTNLKGSDGIPGSKVSNFFEFYIKGTSTEMTGETRTKNQIESDIQTYITGKTLTQIVNGLKDNVFPNWKYSVSEITLTKGYPCLWNCEVTLYDNKEFTVVGPYVMTYYAENGDDGIGIESIIETYFASNSPSTAPTSGWDTYGAAVENWNSSKQFLWNRTIIEYSGNKQPEIKTHVCAIYTTDGVNGNTFWTTSVAPVATGTGYYEFNSSNLLSSPGKPKVGDKIYYLNYIYTISSVLEEYGKILSNNRVELKGEDGRPGIPGQNGFTYRTAYYLQRLALTQSNSTPSKPTTIKESGDVNEWAYFIDAQDEFDLSTYKYCYYQSVIKIQGDTILEIGNPLKCGDEMNGIFALRNHYNYSDEAGIKIRTTDADNNDVSTITMGNSTVNIKSEVNGSNLSLTSQEIQLTPGNNNSSPIVINASTGMTGRINVYRQGQELVQGLFEGTVYTSSADATKAVSADIKRIILIHSWKPSSPLTVTDGNSATRYFNGVGDFSSSAPTTNLFNTNVKPISFGGYVRFSNGNVHPLPYVYSSTGSSTNVIAPYYNQKNKYVAIRTTAQTSTIKILEVCIVFDYCDLGTTSEYMDSSTDSN